MNSWRHLLRLRAGEGRLVLTLGALLLINSFAMQVSYVASVSGFLADGSVNSMLLVWLTSYLMTLGFTTVQFLLIDRFDKRTLLIGASVVFAVLLYAVWWLAKLGAPSWLTYGLLYIVAEQQWLFFPLVFWALANDNVSLAQGKRLFPILASLGFAGKLLGLGLAAVAPALLGRFQAALPELLMLSFVLYLVAAFTATLLRSTPRSAGARREHWKETVEVGVEFVRDVPVFRFLAMCVCALAFAETILEFHFLSRTQRAFSSPEDYQTFYSGYRLFTTTAAFVLQAVVTGRLIERLTLKGAVTVTPFVLLGASSAMLFVPSFASAALGITATRVARDTIDESSQKSLQGVVPSEKRGRVSIFIDSYLLALGTVAACIVTLGVLFLGQRWPLAVTSSVYLAVALVAAGFGVWAAMRMRASYDSSMLNWRLRRRQRKGDVLDRLNS